MSDTPRTDEFVNGHFAMLHGDSFEQALARSWADFARQLERGLAEVKARPSEVLIVQQRNDIDRLRADLARVTAERDAAKSALNEHDDSYVCECGLAIVSKWTKKLVQERDEYKRDAERIDRIAQIASEYGEIWFQLVELPNGDCGFQVQFNLDGDDVPLRFPHLRDAIDAAMQERDDG